MKYHLPVTGCDEHFAVSMSKQLWCSCGSFGVIMSTTRDDNQLSGLFSVFRSCPLDGSWGCTTTASRIL